MALYEAGGLQQDTQRLISWPQKRIINLYIHGCRKYLSFLADPALNTTTTELHTPLTHKGTFLEAVQ